MEVIDTPVLLSPNSEVFFQGFGGVTNQPLHESLPSKFTRINR